MAPISTGLTSVAAIRSALCWSCVLVTPMVFPPAVAESFCRVANGGNQEGRADENGLREWGYKTHEGAITVAGGPLSWPVSLLAQGPAA